MRQVKIVSFFLILLSNFTVANPVFQKGMSYTPWNWNVLLNPQSTRSIQTMRQIGVEWAALTVFWFQDDRTSTSIAPDPTLYSASTESVVKAIADFHSVGIKVMLKPMVDLRTGEWRAAIQPSPAWFESYQEYIVNWAKFAEEHRVAQLCIGCEFVDAVKNPRWDSYWRDIIAAVRQVYPGPLTYAANHGNEMNVHWWDALDYIGIDAYYQLTSIDNPSLAQLAAAWENRANRIEQWRNTNFPEKPVIFTEIGYRSYDGANREPWDYSKHDPNKIDLTEQADCYQAALTVLTSRDWFFGFYWWAWETSPVSGGPNHDGYTIQRKPAETIVKDWYFNRLIGGRFTTAHAPIFQWHR